MAVRNNGHIVNEIKNPNLHVQLTAIRANYMYKFGVMYHIRDICLTYLSQYNYSEDYIDLEIDYNSIKTLKLFNSLHFSEFYE